MLKLSEFPTKAIACVVGHVRDHADHVSLLLVCKRWSRIVADAMYRAPLLQAPDSFERLMSLLNTPLPAHPYPTMIRELDISGIAADNLYMGDLDAALSLCTNLEVFRLENCYHISNILVQSVAHHCPGLLQLDLPGCPVSDSFIPVVAKKCTRLLRLDFSFTNATIASIHPVIAYSDSIVELDLSECKEAEDLKSLDLTPVKGLSRPLKSLNLRNTPVNDQLFAFAVAQCPELEIVVLESCTQLSDAAIVSIASSCLKLRSLDCSFCEVTDAALVALSKVENSCLEELFLSACDSITPGAVHQLLQAIIGKKKLELLVLDGCDRILGSFVQKFAISKGEDGLECTLEREQIASLAAFIPGSLATPPSSPGRQGGAAESFGGLKVVEVTYNSEFSDEKKRKQASHGFAAAVIRRMEGISVKPRANPPPAANTSELTASSSDGGERTIQRRTSRTLRHRKSQLGLSARGGGGDEVEEAEESARFERQEKIRERRRSRGLSIDRERSPPSPPPGFFDHVKPADVPAPDPSENSAAKAAFLIKAAAKGVKVAPPGSVPSPATKPPVPVAASSTSAATSASTAVGSNTSIKNTATSTATTNATASTNSTSASHHNGLVRKSSNLSLKASEFIPLQQQHSSSFNSPSSSYATTTIAPQQPRGPGGPPTWTGSSEALTTTAPQQPPLRRKISIGTPAGPPGGSVIGGWSAPQGITQSPVVVPGKSSDSGSTSTTAENGEKVLLFSGRASRTSSTTASDAPKEETTSVPADTSTSGDGQILIASGRRRSRMNLAADAAAPATGPITPSAISAAGVPTVNNWTSGEEKAPSAKWGADPPVWNPTMSSSSPQIPVQAKPTFADPWARAPASASGPIRTADPWAAAPLSSTISPASSQKSTPSTSGPAPVAWPTPAAAPVVAANGGVTPTPNNIRIVVGAGWVAPPQQVVPPQTNVQQQNNNTAATGHPTTPPRAQRPTIGGRFGSVGATRGVGSWSPAGGSTAAAQTPNGSPTLTPGSVVVAAAAAAAASVATVSPEKKEDLEKKTEKSVETVAEGQKNEKGEQEGISKKEIGKDSKTVEGAKKVADGAQQQVTTNESSVAAPSSEDKIPFDYTVSSEKRGRLLLKLKIETKTGGHQTLAVHEFDEPAHLATDFTKYWGMETFRDPLVRLISVRKSNVLRARAH